MATRELQRQITQIVRSNRALEASAAGAEDNLLLAFRRSETRAWRRVSDLLARAPNFSKTNLQRRLAWYFQNIPSKTLAAAQLEYGRAVTSYLDNYPKLGGFAEKVLAAGRPGKEFSAIPKSLIKRLRDRDLNFFSDLNRQALARLDANFLDAVVVGLTPGKALESIRGTITGSYPWGKTNGLYEWHAGTYARTAQMRFSRQVLKAKADELALVYHVYVGPVDSKKRPFCLNIVGQAFTVEEINDMDNDQTGDVFTTGGGFNCRDSWSPVDKQLFDELRAEGDSGQLIKDEIRQQDTSNLATKAIKGQAPAFPKNPTFQQATDWGGNYGMTIARGPSMRPTTSADGLAVFREMAAVDPKLLKRVAEKGGRLNIFSDGGITVHPDNFRLRGVRPRGHPRRSRWDTVPGMATGKQAYALANKLTTGHGSRALAIHEWAHVMDRVLGGANRLAYQEEFAAIWRADKKALRSALSRRTRAMKKYQRAEIELGDIPELTAPERFLHRPYYKNYVEEYFAEGFARYAGGDRTGISRAMIEYFDKLVAGEI